MAYFNDPRGEWLNNWAARHVEERRGEPFPKDAVELWENLESWLLNYSYWAVRGNRLSIDPIELCENVRDRVLANSAKFEGRAALTTWLNTVGFHVMSSMMKVKRNANTSYLEDELRGRGDDALPETHGTPLELFGGDPKRVLDGLLAKLLSQRDAKILKLRRVNGHTDAEIAAAFHLKPETVHTIVMRAMRRLRLFANGETIERPGSDSQRVRAKHAAS